MSERSDGAYTSAFASWANGWRALQWQERQRVVETEMSACQKGCLTELKTQFNRLRDKHGNGHITLYYITPAVPNLPLLDVRETADEPKCLFICSSHVLTVYMDYYTGCYLTLLII